VPVNEESLQNDIRKKQLSNVYMLYGNDLYLKKHYLDKLSDMAYSGDPFFNLQRFESGSDLQEVYDAVKQYPMMADSKCVVLDNYDFSKSDKKDFEKLCTVISEVESGCVFILKFDTVDVDYKKDSKSKKLIDTVEKAGGKAVCLDHRAVPVLAKMLAKSAVKHGCNLSDTDARYMINMVGEDLNVLSNELQKLCFFCGSGDITKEVIDKICIKNIDSSFYDFVAMIVAGNVSGALSILDDMFFMRIEPFVILSSVSSVYIDMYRVYEGNKAQVKRGDIAKDFDYKSRAFVLDKASNNLKKFDFDKLNKSFECLLSTDYALKSFGADARQKLEEMTVKLTLILWGDTA